MIEKIKKYNWDIGILQIFMYPIYPNFIQSLSVLIFCISSIFRFKFEKNYLVFLLTTSHVLFQMISILWTSDVNFYLKEFSFLFLIFNVNFIFSFFINNKFNKYYSIIHLIFIFSMIIYTILWVKYMITGIDFFCKYVDYTTFFYHNHNYGVSLVDKSLFGLPFLEQNYVQKIYSLINIGFFKNQPIDVISERGYFEIGYQSDFFHHHTYIGLMSLYIVLYKSYSLIKLKQSSLNLFLNVIIIVYFLIFIQLIDSTFIKFFTLLILPVFIYFNLNFRYKYTLFFIIIIANIIFVFFNQKFFFKNIVFYRNEYSIADKTSVIDYIRFCTYKAIYEAISHINIWIGVGVGDVQSLINLHIQKVRVSKGILGHTFIVNSHNQYFSILLKTGIVGTVLFLSSIIFYLKKSLQNKNSLFLFLIISFIFIFIFENVLERVWGVLFFSLFFNLNLYCFENKK